MNEIKGSDTAFRTVSGRNLMEYSFESEEIIPYQLEMIANNRIQGMLKGEVLRVDGKVRLSYDITSLITLQKLFERRELSRNDFLCILKQIVSLIGALDEYLLDAGGLVFESSFIFINPQDLQIELAYLPRKAVPQNLEGLKSLLLNSIIQDIRFKNEPSDNYVQKLIELLKANEPDINIFRDYIKSMEGKTVAVPKTSVDQPIPKSIPVITEVPEKKTKAVLAIPETKPASRQDAVKSTKLCYPLRSFIILGMVVTAFALFGVALSFTETFSPDNPDLLLSLFGYLMIGGALTYLVYSKLFTPDKRIVTQAEHKNEQIQPPVKKMEYVNKAFTIPETRTYQAKAEVAVVQVQDHTVILDAGSLKQPSLKGTGETRSETIIITRFPFMVGRLEGQVDYCLKNPAVGKMHAEIKKTEAGYFITDMNTRNGTMLSGERLAPSREYKLEDGARIAFANAEFIFTIGRQE